MRSGKLRVLDLQGDPKRYIKDDEDKAAKMMITWSKRSTIKNQLKKFSYAGIAQLGERQTEDLKSVYDFYAPLSKQYTGTAAAMEEEQQRQQKQSKWKLERRQYLGEISALCFLHPPSNLFSLPFLLAGTGSQLLLYNLESGNIIESFQVFDGIRVHGITCSFNEEESSPFPSSTVSFKIAVFGEKRVKLFNLHIQTHSRANADLALIHCLPKFTYWVLDNYAVSSNEDGRHCLAIGCSDNSVHLWDTSVSSVILQVQSPERCLLYSMRLWGNNLETLRIASGTIFNEVPNLSLYMVDHCLESGSCRTSMWRSTFDKSLGRLIGHEGSIFRMAWSSDGSKLVSVSDDRSARIWAVRDEPKDSDNKEEVAGPVLFGHNARVWDCCICDSLIVTAGEDCTCRIWKLDGKQLKMIKEHVGRGVWRCLYDPTSSLLITAGFDSSIKVHQVSASFSQSLEGQTVSKPFTDRMEMFTCRIPNLSAYIGFMDSKSEYVRCLHFTCEDTLYVATNNGYLYHVRLFGTKDVKWTKLSQLSEEVPIVCMDLLSKTLPEHSNGIDDWVALGDGKGNMTIVRVMGDVFTPEVDFIFTWSAGKERQLLGTYWCKALGCRFIFTADPRGILKLWRLGDFLPSGSLTSGTFDASLIAEFTSCFGMRIMCLDVLFEDEVLICGDLRGAHGISTVSSISVAKLSSDEIEIRSTGGDGCICYLEYDHDRRGLEFIGMKQVKELSLIQSVSADNKSLDDLANCGYAIGFASTDFIIWNLISEAKVVQIPCGGWRRPHSYYLGDVPEAMNCFAYVKVMRLDHCVDEVIYIHRQWVPERERKIFPKNLHIQFHGREMHSLCFVSKHALVEANGKHIQFDKSSWIATGCEDGTVRLTRYMPGIEGWVTSKLLGEHVGGSAVRSICSVSKMHIIASDVTNLSDWRKIQNTSAGDIDNPFLLISVGAKRVLTSWLLRDRKLDKEHSLFEQENIENGNGYMPPSGVSSSMSFKWLSTDMPPKYSSAHGKTKGLEKIRGITKYVDMNTDATSRPFLLEKGERESKSSHDDKYEDDWRYLAVTAFLVKCAGSRLTVCFVVVACSDATLTLRALVLPHRLWFDVALLVPLSSPVLTLQHVIIPGSLPSEEKIHVGSVYIVISGATDGSIAFWDLTDNIEAFVQRLSSLNIDRSLNCQTRPRTGRGSQGGRWWRTLSNSVPKNRLGDGLVAIKAGESTNNHPMNGASTTNDAKSHTTVYSQAVENAPHEPEANSPGTCEIWPFHVFNNVHQSGVNSLHISDVHNCQSSESGFVFSVVSGGDDQALHCLKFDLSLLSTGKDSEIVTSDVIDLFPKSKSMNNPCRQSQTKKYRIKFLYHDRIPSAHSSAIKGVWTDGLWVFSTGLDQRIRCWLLQDDSKLVEQAHLIISVPEPEALHARAFGRNHYEIAVAGRGMQMVEFSAS
ncbi:unnamed protein product [Dovyalis caffra]|uniref:WD repeat-containing protein 6 n=1 Tax=Dovyalis caffra TaxID=77055 RepID=A0AAV1SB55_9ROSI|nr:unnamed protein product [Dovyalis caffra]